MPHFALNCLRNHGINDIAQMFTLVKMLSLSPKYLLYLFVNSFIDNNHRQRECTMNGLGVIKRRVSDFKIEI